MDFPSGHSPLGASGAERWMECPGSTALLSQLDLGETDDPDYRVDGTTAHAGAAVPHFGLRRLGDWWGRQFGRPRVPR